MLNINNNIPISFKAQAKDHYNVNDEPYSLNTVHVRPNNEIYLTQAHEWVTQNFDTSPTQGFRRYDYTPKYPRFYDLPPLTKEDIIQSRQNLDVKLRKTCCLENSEGNNFDEKLYNHLTKAKKDYALNGRFFSTRQIIDICNASKLRKADNSQYVDYDMLKAGFYWADRFYDNNNSDLKNILKASIVNDEEGNEVFLKDSVAYIDSLHYSAISPKQIQDVLKKYVSKTENGEYVFNRNEAQKSLFEKEAPIEQPSAVTNTSDRKKANLETKLRRACFVEGKNGKRFDNTLYEYLKEAQANYYKKNKFFSTPEIIDICNSSKLRKSDNTQYIDYDMIDAGFYWANRYVSNDNTDLKNILKASVKTNQNGNEVFMKDSIEYILGLKKPTMTANEVVTTLKEFCTNSQTD